MLIRSSGHISDGFFLFSLGESCHYALAALNPHTLDDDSSPQSAPSLSETFSPAAIPPARIENVPFVVFDPGTTAHAQQLAQRFTQAGLKIENLSLILLTHLHPERCAGASWLASRAGNAKVVGSSQMAAALRNSEVCQALLDADLGWSKEFGIVATPPNKKIAPLTIHEEVMDGEILGVGDDVTIRVLNSPGHTAESLWYLIQPHGILIGDDLIGHYRGRSPPTPAADFDFEGAQASLKRLERVAWSGIGLPFNGLLVGKPARGFPKQVATVLEEVKAQIEHAKSNGISAEEIRAALQEQLFSSLSRDPVLRATRERSLSCVLKMFSVEAPQNS